MGLALYCHLFFLIWSVPLNDMQAQSSLSSPEVTNLFLNAPNVLKLLNNATDRRTTIVFITIVRKQNNSSHNEARKS